MGCQDLLENVPGRSKAGSVPLPGWSPSENRSSFMSRGNRSRGASARNLSKSEDLSSKQTLVAAIKNRELGARNWAEPSGLMCRNDFHSMSLPLSL